MCYGMELTACAADGRSTQCFSIEDESASEASSRRVRGSSWGGLMVSSPRVSIDLIDILGVDGGGSEKRRGLLQTAREMTWVAAQKRRVCHVPTSCHLPVRFSVPRTWTLASLDKSTVRAITCESGYIYISCCKLVSV